MRKRRYSTAGSGFSIPLGVSDPPGSSVQVIWGVSQGSVRRCRCSSVRLVQDAPGWP